jgi:ribonuclease P protein component
MRLSFGSAAVAPDAYAPGRPDSFGYRGLPAPSASSVFARPEGNEHADATTKLQRVKRANRLSRSRDFDGVYRQGRSVSSRFLVLYWFPQDEPAEPRFGLSVPKAVGGATVRNRVKRQLREIWRERLSRVPEGHDYVLIVRGGLPEAAEANGFEWLGGCVDELLAQAGVAG